MGTYVVVTHTGQLLFVSRDWNTVRNAMILNPSWYYVYTEADGATDLRGKQRHDDTPAKESSLPPPKQGGGEPQKPNCPQCGGSQDMHFAGCTLDFTKSSGVVR